MKIQPSSKSNPLLTYSFTPTSPQREEEGTERKKSDLSAALWENFSICPDLQIDPKASSVFRVASLSERNLAVS